MAELLDGRKRVRVEQLSVRVLFLIAVALGSLSVLVGLALDSSLLAITLPVLVMGGYILAVTRWQTDMPQMVVGDSCYYLGFILTLVSLVASLVSLSGSSEIEMSNIVGTFGAALLTTIVGLIARLMITAFSIRTTERRARLETEIESALNTFSSQVEELINVATNSMHVTHAQSQAALKRSLDLYEDFNKDCLDQLRKSADSNVEVLEQAFKHVAQRIGEVRVDPDMVARPMDEAVAKLVQTITAHSESSQSLTGQLAVTNESLSKQLAQSNELVQGHLKAFENAFGNLVADQMTSYKHSLGETTSSILENVAEVRSFRDEIAAGVKDDITSLRESVSSLNGEIAGLSKMVVGHVTALDESAATTAKHIESSKKAALLLNEVSTAFSTAEEMMQKFGGAVGVVEAATQSIADVTTTTSSVAERMKAIAESTESASSQVAKDISSVYGQLAEQLRAIRQA